jgi:phosphatidylglycerol:prolipoprotein diacylglycerol transferase
MQQTLFSIPHSWFEGPLLVAWLIIGGLVTAFNVWRHGWSDQAFAFLPMFGIVAAIIWFVLPAVEVFGVNPNDPLGPFIKQGLAIRGYGLFMVLGIAAGTWLVLMRCRQAGTDPDQILTLAFWMIVCGIVGARAFFVIQNRDQFFGTGVPTGQALLNIVDMTKGGLVVYGSLIGGMIAAVVFFRVTRQPFGRLADLIAPGMVLGLAFGRLGCLMNGCCFGGVCAAELPAIQFPPGSPPYMRQLEEGQLLGLTTNPVDKTSQSSSPLDFQRAVRSVRSDSIAESLGIEPGQKLNIYVPDSLRLRHFKTQRNVATSLDQELAVIVDTDQGSRLSVPLSSLPGLSLRVHPTQIYSAMTAALLCVTLWYFWPVRQTDGEVFALMLILYPIARFLHEIIRRDEAGQFGTDLTISQWVSIATVLLGFLLFGWFRMYGKAARVRANPE